MIIVLHNSTFTCIHCRCKDNILHKNCICVSLAIRHVLYLKEKLPQAFMQIEWMENYFRNPTAKVWANLDNPIKSYFLYAVLSGGTVLIYVMSQQYNCPMELYTNVANVLLFMKMHLPSTFILRYVRAKMIVHALWLNLINWAIDIQEKMYKVNGEFFSCNITDSGIVPTREGDIQNFA